jgi:hypothetical protein
MEILPNELLEKILRYVPGKDLTNSVALVNRRFLALTRSTPLMTHLDTTGMTMEEATKRIELAHRNLHTVKIEGKVLRLLMWLRAFKYPYRTELEVRTIVICTVKFNFNHIYYRYSLE